MELWGFTAPSRRQQKGREKGKAREGAAGPAVGAANAHLLRGLRGPDERGSSPPWGRRVTVMEARKCPGDNLEMWSRRSQASCRGAWGSPRSHWAVDVDVPPPAAPSPPHRWAMLWGGVHVLLALVARGGTGGQGGPGGPVPDPTPLLPPQCGHPGGQQSPLTLPVLSGGAVVGAGRAVQRDLAVTSSRRCATTPPCPVTPLLTPRKGARSWEEPEQRPGAGEVNVESVPQTGPAPV